MNLTRIVSGSILMVSGLLTLIVNLPYFNEFFPIKTVDGFGPGFISVTLNGGAHFFPSELKLYSTVLGETGLNIIPINGWSVYSLPGFVFFLAFLSTGCISMVLGYKTIFNRINLIKTLFVSLFVSIVNLTFISLLFVSKCNSINTFGISTSCLGKVHYYGIVSNAEIGIGLYLLFFAGVMTALCAFVVTIGRKGSFFPISNESF